MKRMAGRSSLPRFFLSSARASLISLIPERTAEYGRKTACVSAAMIRARVVFPEPGGPQKMRDGKGRAASTDERNFPSPRISSCPTKPARDVGRILSASGARGAIPPFRPEGLPGKRGYEDPEDGILFLFSFRYIILIHH